MKIINRITVILFSIALGIFIGRITEIHRSRELNANRQMEYIKILSNYREVDKTLDRLKYTIAKKCNDAEKN